MSWFVLCSNTSNAQELQATININHSQIQGTDNTVFDNLRNTLSQFINERKWTNLQFQKNERIPCSFNITVTKYDRATNMFTCKAIIQANRPVYNSAYSTTLYNNISDPQKVDFPLNTGLASENLNLSKLYVLTSKFTASASEAVIN